MKKKLRLRKVQLSDCRRIWYWRNEKEVRKFSFQHLKIPYAQHQSWFKAKLSDSKSIILIAENASQEPIGQARFDRLNLRLAEVHIIIEKNSRNQGWGQILLSKACQYGFRTLKLKNIKAQILSQNSRSLVLFQNLGFKTKGSRKIKKQVAYTLILTKNAKKAG